MADKRYYWLQLPVGFFKERAIKKLKRMAGGATYTIIYQKLLLLSLENEGNINFENIEESFEEEMSLELDENLEDIQMTILFLIKNNLMEKKDSHTYFMTQVPEMIGSETDSARRKRKSRHNNKLKNVTMSQLNETKSQAVTNGHTEIEIEKDIYIKQQQHNNKNKKSNVIDNVNKTLVNNSKKENVVVDVVELKNKIEFVINSKIKQKGLNRLLEESDIDTINLYLENWEKFKYANKGNPTGFFIDACINKYSFPKAEKGQRERNKPVQSTNYDQRKYSDEFWDGLYDNIEQESIERLKKMGKYEDDGG